MLDMKSDGEIAVPQWSPWRASTSELGLCLVESAVVSFSFMPRLVKSASLLRSEEQGRAGTSITAQTPCRFPLQLPLGFWRNMKSDGEIAVQQWSPWRASTSELALCLAE